MDPTLIKKLICKVYMNENFNRAYTKMKILYPIINYSSTWQIKCSLIMCTLIIRSLITYLCMYSMSRHILYKSKKITNNTNQILRIALKPSMNGIWKINNSTIILEYYTWLHRSKTNLKNFIQNLIYLKEPSL